MAGNESGYTYNHPPAAINVILKIEEMSANGSLINIQ
jgi:hypothetical protein